MATLIKGYQISPQQKHLWSLQQENNSFYYCATSAIRIDGNIDIKVLKKALVNVINRHEILRTTFYCLPEKAIPLQVIQDKYIPSINEYNLSSLDPQEQEVKIETLFDEGKRQHIDFQKDSLLQISLINLSPCRHMLLVNLPALCADTATLNNLMREINRSYTACLHEEKLSDEPMQYIVVAQWQNELLESEDGEVAREYWRKQNFSGIFTLKLPFENQPSGKPKFEPQVFNLSVDPNLSSKLRTLVQQFNTSSSILLLSCWLVLLWKLIGQSDIIIGTACDGRTDEELEEAFGLFTKYLPLKCHLEEHTQFSGLLEQVEQLTHEIYEWQECFTWKQISASVKNQTEQNYCPICFDFDKQSEKCSNADLTFSIYKQYACVDRFNLKLSCIERDTSLSTEFHYDTNLFLSEDIERLAGQFHKLLESVLNNPKAEISKLDILTDIERQQLLVDFNNTKTDFPIDICIHQLFEEQTKRTPDAVAVVFENEQLTYQELNQRANQLAHYLHSLGVEPEVCVGICMERSPLMVIGLLGILKAGGAYVPLDPEYPKERLAFMLNDAQMSILLTEAQLVEKFPEHGTQVICLDINWEANVCYAANQHTLESFENPAFGVMTENLAYVIYTSGSTGKPKGTLIPHRGLVNYLAWCTQAYAVEQGDGTPIHSSISFDMTITGLFSPLLVGRRVELLPEKMSIDSLGAALRNKSNYSLVKITPAHLEILPHQLSPQLAAGKTRAFIIGGENLLAQSTTFWQEFAPDTILVNEYGPTETVVGCCTYQVPLGLHHTGSIPIGRPIANTQLYILDSHLNPVPIGVRNCKHKRFKLQTSQF